MKHDSHCRENDDGWWRATSARCRVLDSGAAGAEDDCCDGYKSIFWIVSNEDYNVGAAESAATGDASQLGLRD